MLTKQINTHGAPPRLAQRLLGWFRGYKPWHLTIDLGDGTRDEHYLWLPRNREARSGWIKRHVPFWSSTWNGSVVISWRLCPV